MFENLISNISKTIVGNVDKIKLTLAAIISEGSILIEDNPGSGKTTLAKTITLNLGLNFKRIQFTSDLLPSDILGYNILKDEKLIFQKGPIFTNIVLGDELNRASPKTQSAFLEAMEEKTVTIDKETFNLPNPFCVIATQNPSDLSGTSLLPESQLDRFMVSFSLDELSDKQQLELLKNDYLNFEINKNDLEANYIEKIQKINLSENIYEYIQNINNFFKSKYKEIHISPRCLKQIISLSKSLAFINGKDYVTFQDIKDILPFILKHRVNIIEKNKVLNFIKEEVLEKVDLPDDN